ncbi:hypothetical protein RF11_16198 [Thelohanellus kitauei]|uniref:Uncharacterized protein n=1 Tax=Thelohanellus kitauei TaxID=669202 RepID=A0A0C2JYI8_THEKT|nr:hypothetical protein RF11_16198 [Thelohanellus kitauei]
MDDCDIRWLQLFAFLKMNQTSLSVPIMAKEVVNFVENHGGIEKMNELINNNKNMGALSHSQIIEPSTSQENIEEDRFSNQVTSDQSSDKQNFKPPPALPPRSSRKTDAIPPVVLDKMDQSSKEDTTSSKRRRPPPQPATRTQISDNSSGSLKKPEDAIKEGCIKSDLSEENAGLLQQIRQPKSLKKRESLPRGTKNISQSEQSLYNVLCSKLNTMNAMLAASERES